MNAGTHTCYNLTQADSNFHYQRYFMTAGLCRPLS